MLDSALFRSALGRFASGVTIVTARSADAGDHGTTVSAFCSVSLEPPLVLICIDRAAVIHDVVTGAGHFAVNVLAAGQEPISRRFAELLDDRFEGIGYTRGVTGTILLDDVLASIECRRVSVHPAGDHTIIIGEVVAAAVHANRPLLYYRGGYAQLER